MSSDLNSANLLRETTRMLAATGIAPTPFVLDLHGENHEPVNYEDDISSASTVTIATSYADQEASINPIINHSLSMTESQGAKLTVPPLSPQSRAELLRPRDPPEQLCSWSDENLQQEFDDEELDEAELEYQERLSDLIADTISQLKDSHWSDRSRLGENLVFMCRRALATDRGAHSENSSRSTPATPRPVCCSMHSPLLPHARIAK